jgi:hypothetical protein
VTLPQLAGYTFDLVHFRSINGSDLPSILPVSQKIVLKRKLKAFVGHRFNDTVTPNLRHNLAILFKAYGIQPWYSDSDSPNGPVFQIILDRIHVEARRTGALATNQDGNSMCGRYGRRSDKQHIAEHYAMRRKVVDLPPMPPGYNITPGTFRVRALHI